MLALKYVLMAGGLGMILAAVSILGYDLYRELLYRRALATPGAGTVPPLPQWRWRTSVALALLAWGPILLQADHGPVAFRNIRVRRRG